MNLLSNVLVTSERKLKYPGTFPCIGLSIKRDPVKAVGMNTATLPPERRF